MIALTLRGMAQRRLRTILTAMAVVLGVAMVSASFTVSNTMRKGADSLTSAAYDGTDAVVTARSTVKRTDIEQAHPTLSAAIVDRVARTPGVAVATGDITQEAKIIGSDGKVVGDGPFFGVGLDAAKPGATELTPFHLTSGTWATGPGQVVLDQGTADKQHLKVGDRVRIAGRGPARSYELAGTARFGSVKTIGHATISIFDLRTAQSVIGTAGRYDDVLVKAAPGTSAPVLRARLARMLGPDVKVQTARAEDRFTLDGLKQFVAIIKAILLGFGIVSIIVGGATILNALSITVAQRSRELALLRTLGGDRGQVRRSVKAEAAVIGVGGSVVGIGVGYVLAKGLVGVLASMGLDLPRAGMAFGAGPAAFAAAVGIGTTMLAASVPARRATRVAPVEALREGAEPTRGFIRRGVARGVAALVSVLGRPGEKLAGISGVLARRNAMRNPGRTGATAAALTIGVTLVVGVATLSAAFQDATKGQATRAVGSSYVLSDAQWGPFEAGAAEQLKGAPGVDAVAPLRQSDALAYGQKIRVDGVEPAATAKALHYQWVHGSQATLAALRPGDALVRDGYAKAHGLHVGSAFTVTTPAGDRVPVTVRGITERPALNPLFLGDVTIPQAAFASAFPPARPSIAFLDAPGTTPAALQARLAGYPNTTVRSSKAYADHVAQPFKQILAIFEVLLALAVIVSLFGIVNTLVLSVLERTRELGLLRAAGMSRRQVRRMVRQESIITALVGTAMGIAIGIGIGALAIGLLPIGGLALTVPTGAIVTTVIVAIVCGVWAAIVPARRAAKMDVLAAVSYA